MDTKMLLWVGALILLVIGLLQLYHWYRVAMTDRAMAANEAARPMPNQTTTGTGRFLPPNLIQSLRLIPMARAQGDTGIATILETPSEAQIRQEQEARERALAQRPLLRLL